MAKSRVKKSKAPVPTNTDIQTVVTFDGTVAKKTDCRRIGGEYYVIGDHKKKDSGQVYQIDGTFYRESAGKIAWDHENKEYSLIGSLVEGIVDFDKAGAVLGYFTPNIYKNVKIYEYESPYRNLTWLFSEEILEKVKNYNRDIIVGAYAYDFKGNLLSRLSNPGHHQKQKIDGFDTTIYGFNNNGGVKYSVDLFERYLAETEYKIEPFIEKLSEFIGNYTFGFEFETYNGTMPLNELVKNGLIPVKDGSISGHEYITIVHKGVVGLQAVYNSCKSLSKWCNVDRNCSMHIHVGNVPKDKEFIIAFYMLCYQLQHELHETIAPYKKDINYLASKAGGPKDHCQYLSSLGLFQNNIYTSGNFDKELGHNFSKIFTWLNDGHPESKDYSYETGIHIKHGRPKWEIHSRYYWINLFNLVFSNTKTIENRLHSGTLNPTKSINWLLITIALIEFTKKKKEEIIRAKTKYKLDDIIEEAFAGKDNSDVLIDYLKEYIIARKSNHYKLSMRMDMYGNEFDSGDVGFRPIDKIKL